MGIMGWLWGCTQDKQARRRPILAMAASQPGRGEGEPYPAILLVVMQYRAVH